MKLAFLIFLYPFIFKPSSFSRLTGSPDIKFFSSASIYPSLIPFFEEKLLLYFDYRKPYGIKEWNEINFSASLKNRILFNIFQKRLMDYSETEINASFASKVFKKLSFSISLDYLVMNSIIKKEDNFDFDISFSFIYKNVILSSNLKHVLNSFNSRNYYFSFNFSPFDRFKIFFSIENNSKKAGFYLLLRPIMILISFSENFMNTGFGLIFEDKTILFSFEDNSYLGLSTGVSFELKR